MCKKNGIVSKKFQGERKDCPDTDNYMATILHPLLKAWNADDIYNADETALYYKQLPGSTLTFCEDTPGGSKMNKARLTLLLIINMSGILQMNSGLFSNFVTVHVFWWCHTYLHQLCSLF